MSGINYKLPAKQRSMHLFDVELSPGLKRGDVPRFQIVTNVSHINNGTLYELSELFDINSDGLLRIDEESMKKGNIPSGLFGPKEDEALFIGKACEALMTAHRNPAPYLIEAGLIPS